MNIAVIGVNHKTCPIEMREKVAFTHSRVMEGMRWLREVGISENIILSTCNRSEIYIASVDLKGSIEKVKHFYRDFFREGDIGAYLFAYEGREAITHLYEVTAGLDSIVVGEDQILGQVKESLKLAMETHASGKVLNKVFREAITTAKMVKYRTKMSEHALSISRIAVKFLKEKQGDLKDKVGLLIGTGKMNELTVKYLLEEEVSTIYVANRTHTNAISLTEKYEGLLPVRYEERYKLLEKVDFVVSATASPHIILKKELMPPLKRHTYIMDIAMPRDIDPAIDQLPFAHVYDIDDLKAISDSNNERRKALALDAKQVLKAPIDELMVWLESLCVDPIIWGLHERCESIEKHTLEAIYKKIDLEEEEKLLLEKLLGCALKKVVREPIANLRNTTDEKERLMYAKVLSELFELGKCEENK